MDEVLYDYIGEKFVEDLKNGKNVSEKLCNSIINSFPYIDVIRNKFTETDIKLFLGLLGNNKKYLRLLGIYLCVNLEDHPDIRKSLLKIWEENSDFESKFHVMWRILDYEDIPLELHKNILSFILKHENLFHEFNIKSTFGDKKLTFNLSFKRLYNKTNINRSFPETKKWIYLMQAYADPQNTELKQLLSNFKNSDFEMTSYVANMLLKRISESDT